MSEADTHVENFLHSKMSAGKVNAKGSDAVVDAEKVKTNVLPPVGATCTIYHSAILSFQAYVVYSYRYILDLTSCIIRFLDFFFYLWTFV